MAAELLTDLAEAFPTERSNNASALPACSLSTQDIFGHCSCNSRCVAMVVLMAPLIVLSCWAAYRGAHCLLWERREDELRNLAAERAERGALAAIHSLPTRVWGGKSGADCSLCLDAFARGQVVRQLPCGHTFHVHCIDRWLIRGQQRRTRKCPLCRSDPLEAPGGVGSPHCVKQQQQQQPPTPTQQQSQQQLLLLPLHRQQGQDEQRRHSEGAPRPVLGAELRRQSSPARVATTQVLMIDKQINKDYGGGDSG